MSRADAPVRPDAVRRHNLARLLTEIHRHGELSRAELTSRLGLNRSTIGTLVGELVTAGLLRGEIPDATTRAETSAGRPSHVVGPRPEGPVVVAVDLDVDRIAVAAVGIGGAVVRRHQVDRPADPADIDAVIQTVAGAVIDVVHDVPGRTLGVGVSVPGSVDRLTGMVLLAPNLGWQRVDLVGRVATELAAAGIAAPVAAGNDANLAAVAEHVRGVGRGHDDIVFLLGRVGVGAGIIAGGRLMSGHSGSAGEVGHLCLDTAGPPCHCGNHGCAELYIGDAALLAAVGITDRHAPEDVEQLLDAAAAGHRAELDAVQQVGAHLGRTVAAVLNLVDPAVVIAGGTLARVLDLAGGRTHAELARYAFGPAGLPVQLCSSSLGHGPASLLGAAELAFEPLLRDPTVFSAYAAVEAPANWVR